MKFMQHLTASIFALALSALLLLAGCGGGGLLADGGIIGTGSITGTVPGTIIEAYGDNGEYYQTSSAINETSEHPFVLQLPAGVGFYLVMIVNEETQDEIVMPIAFPGNKQGEVLARLVLREGEEVDLGHIPLFLNCNEVPFESDPDDDCILDKPFILNEDKGANNPLKQLDADDDGINDFDDDDHGYGSQNNLQSGDSQDHDRDRVPNFYDDDFEPDPGDEDGDGIDDDEDENPGNVPDDDLEYSSVNWNGQDMHPLDAFWLDEHGDYAEQDYDSCATCHGEDFMGTALSGQVGCYDCHNGPYYDDSAGLGPGPGPGNNGEDSSTWQWNNQNMHQIGQTWVDEHGEFAEYNYAGCADCHGSGFKGSPLSATAANRNFYLEGQGQTQFRAGYQIGCYDCHNGPDPEDDSSEEEED